MNKRIEDMFNLTGKVAIITGGAGLLGEKHAEAIAEFGGIAVLLDVNEELNMKVAERIFHEFHTDCIALKCDVTRKPEIEKVKDKLVSDYGSIDILINNAALNPKMEEAAGRETFNRFEFFKEEQWDAELAAGLTAAFLCSQVFGQVMVKKGKGAILNISSDLGIIAPDQRIYKEEGLPEDQQGVKPVTYSVIKHGIIGLTKYLATYWAEKGIRVNALCPGGIFNNQPQEFVKRLTTLIPLGRMADKNEYKAAVVFLVSEASSYMTGSVLIIDGGRTCW